MCSVRAEVGDKEQGLFEKEAHGSFIRMTIFHVGIEEETRPLSYIPSSDQELV